MNLILLSAISEIGLFIICQLIFLQYRKHDFRASVYFLLIGFSFLITGYLFLMDYIGFSIPFTSEIKVMQIVVMSILLILIIARISKIKKLEALVPILFVPLFATIMYNIPWQHITMSMAHYVTGIVFFVLFLLSTREIRYAGLFGLAYAISTISLLFTTSLSLLNTVIFIPNVLLIIFFSFFLRHGLEFDHVVHPQKFDIRRAKGIWMSFLHLIVYIILLNVAVLSASIVLHEAGHLFTGSMYGCESGQIILLELFPQNPGPYTELSCPEPIQEVILAISGFFFIVPFGIIFLFLRRFPEKNFAYIIFGLAIILGSLDMLIALPYTFIPYLFMFVGMFVMSLGEMLLIYDYTSDHESQHEFK